MADYDSEVLRGRSPAQARGADIDADLRSYMLRVYNYMAGGLAITGVIAYFAYTMAVVQTPQGLALSGFGQFLFASPFKWLVMLAPLGMVFLLSFRVHKMSVGAAQAAFWSFAAVMGLSMASIFLVFTGASIFQVFLITAASFGALSLWGYTTSKDISGWGSFLFMGLIGVILASVVNIFLGSGALQFAISVIGVLVFAGLTAYDTQQIKEMYDVNDDGTVAGRKAIMGALRLYLDFINLFIMLLQLFGSRE